MNQSMNPTVLTNPTNTERKQKRRNCSFHYPYNTSTHKPHIPTVPTVPTNMWFVFFLDSSISFLCSQFYQSNPLTLLPQMNTDTTTFADNNNHERDAKRQKREQQIVDLTENDRLIYEVDSDSDSDSNTDTVILLEEPSCGSVSGIQSTSNGNNDIPAAIADLFMDYPLPIHLPGIRFVPHNVFTEEAGGLSGRSTAIPGITQVALRVVIQRDSLTNDSVAALALYVDQFPPLLGKASLSLGNDTNVVYQASLGRLPPTTVALAAWTDRVFTHGVGISLTTLAHELRRPRLVPTTLHFTFGLQPFTMHTTTTTATADR